MPVILCRFRLIFMVKKMCYRWTNRPTDWQSDRPRDQMTDGQVNRFFEWLLRLTCKSDKTATSGIGQIRLADFVLILTSFFGHPFIQLSWLCESCSEVISSVSPRVNQFLSLRFPPAVRMVLNRLSVQWYILGDVFPTAIRFYKMIHSNHGQFF